eukprot:15347739-Ditylum_brightwellii.AAC.1
MNCNKTQSICHTTSRPPSGHTKGYNVTAISRVNDDGCLKYRNGDFFGSFLSFQKGLQLHDDSSKECSFCRERALTMEAVGARRCICWRGCTISPRTANAMEQDLELDEGMSAFENVHEFGVLLSSEEFTPDHNVVFAFLLFNAGQACHRVSAFDEASTLYTAAKHALERKTESPLDQPSTDVAASSSSNTTHPLKTHILHNIGQIQYRNGQMQEALRTLSEALSLDRVIHTGDHLEVATTLNSIGVIHYHNSP